MIMGAVASPGSDLAAVLTWALRRTALRRLVEQGAAEGLLDLAPGLGDRWLAYLALAPATIIDDLLAGPAGE